jgi:hypothetical protein
LINKLLENNLNEIHVIDNLSAGTANFSSKVDGFSIMEAFGFETISFSLQPNEKQINRKTVNNFMNFYFQNVNYNQFILN